MCSALGDFDFFYRMTANGARVSVLLVNLKIILKIATAINPIDAGSFLVNPLG